MHGLNASITTARPASEWSGTQSESTDPRKIVIVHLTASRFYGGPERQMLGLAENLPRSYQTVFLSFWEKGLCRAFLEEADRAGFRTHSLGYDTPHLVGALRDVMRLLRSSSANILCCHGYKANLLGRMAAQRLRIAVIGISRGWTGQCFRVRLYEALDRLVLRFMDKVVCVSRAQAEMVRRAGVPSGKIVVIPNAIRLERFSQPHPEYRRRVQSLFRESPRFLIGAAGRLSPEKGFDILVEAAAQVRKDRLGVGFVLFGDGPLRDSLKRQIDSRGLNGSFVLAGFTPDLDCYFPYFDVLAVPSFTEGMPNVVLEAFAAGVPVVATAVGGTPELVEHGISGYLIPPRDAAALARGIIDLASRRDAGREMGRRGREMVRSKFTFAEQARRYCDLFRELNKATALWPRSSLPESDARK